MRRIVADTRLVLEWSRKTQHLVLWSILAPVLIFALGAFCVAIATFREPFATLESDALTYILRSTSGASCSVWMSTTALAGKEFFRARRQIFGSIPPSRRKAGASPIASFNYGAVVPAVESQALS